MGRYRVKHLQGIDGLRGVFALLVLFYHTSYWLKMPYPDWLMSILRIWGIYGVEGFFVISGIALSLSIKPSQFLTLRGYFVFFIRRYSRIWPLYAVLVFLHIRSSISGSKLFELSMLFGFVDSARSTLVGGWTIGVEFVFYFLFPLLALLCSSSKYKSGIAVFLSAVLLVWYSTLFNPEASLATQNSLYVNPANHLFFFITGYFFGVLYKDSGDALSGLLTNRHLLTLCFVIFVSMSIFGYNTDQIDLLAGYKRLLLSLMVVSMIGSLMYLDVPQGLTVFFGNISYSLYLLHPMIVFNLLALMPIENPWFKLVITLVISIPLAYLSHRYFEMPAQRLIRKVANA